MSICKNHEVLNLKLILFSKWNLHVFFFIFVFIKTPKIIEWSNFIQLWYSLFCWSSMLSAIIIYWYNCSLKFVGKYYLTDSHWRHVQAVQTWTWYCGFVCTFIYLLVILPGWHSLYAVIHHISKTLDNRLWLSQFLFLASFFSTLSASMLP